ncbi:MAG: TetR/AcrR family transcriptional regulator [Ilumatobacter sp.]|nr:TetR/AcrR family transcriptional regulator [Ilumatobacter sp.]
MPRVADPARRAAIVDTARQRLTTVGYNGTTIGDLATEIGISKAAIAYYFPTKNTFLDEFVTPVLDRLEAALAEADEPRAALLAYLDVLIDAHDIAIWIDTDPTVQNHPVHGARLARVNRQLLSLLTGRSRRKADRIRGLSILGGVWRPVRELSADDLRAHRDEIVDTAMTTG